MKLYSRLENKTLKKVSFLISYSVGDYQLMLALEWTWVTTENHKIQHFSSKLHLIRLQESDYPYETSLAIIWLTLSDSSEILIIYDEMWTTVKFKIYYY